MHLVKMRYKFIFAFVFVVIFGIALSSAQTTTTTTTPAFTQPATNVFNTPNTASLVNQQSAQPSFQTTYSSSDMYTYWPILGNNQQECNARQDLVLMVPPGGCQPTVVRSDLLADQNVPVFCEVDALRINPLLDIKSIDNIGFSSTYPPEILTSGFHPARAALSNRDILTDGSLINDIGYVVVVLKQNPKEKTLPNQVALNLTANIQYTASNSIGVGKAQFRLTPQTDADWANTRVTSSFWSGRYYARLMNADSNLASVAIYQGDTKISTQSVQRGSTTKPFYLPGSYCQAGLQIAYDGLEAADKRATIEVRTDGDSEMVNAYEKTTFADSKCTITGIHINEEQAYFSKQVNERNANDFLSGTVSISCANQGFTLSLTKLAQGATSTSVDAAITDPLTKAIFNATITNYTRIADTYPAEKDANGLGQAYGQTALMSAIDLADAYHQYAMKDALIQKLNQKYPSSGYYASDQILSKIYNLNQSSQIIYIDNKKIEIKLLALNLPLQQATLSLSYAGKTLPLERNVPTNLPTDGTDGTIVATSVYPDRATFTVSFSGKNSACPRGTQDITILSGQFTTICGKQLRLNAIDNVQQTALVRIIPYSRGTTTQANLSVVIGIDKRAIQLSPERTKEMISNLNKSIEEWQSWSDKLGKFNQGLQTACLATAATLTIEHLFTSGAAALARGDALKKWDGQCANEVAQKVYPTIDACLAAHNSDIEKDVKTYADAYTNTNDAMSKIENNPNNQITGSGGLFGGTSINQDNAKIALCKQLPSSVKPANIDCAQQNSTYTYEEMRQLYFNSQLNTNSDNTIKSTAINNVNSITKSINDNVAAQAAIDKANAQNSLGLPTVYNMQVQGYNTISTQTKTADSILSNTNPAVANTKTALATAQAKDKSITSVARMYISSPGTVPATQQGQPPTTIAPGTFDIFTDAQGTIKAVANENNPSTIISGSDFQTAYKVGQIQSVDANSMHNQMSSSVKIQYYETEPYKGLPALVPFDRQNGWYVATKQTVSSFGGLKAFDSSGMPANFYICNVGTDGIADFLQGGNDWCQMVNLGAGNTAVTLDSLNPSESSTLITKAKNALLQAANCYGKGSTCQIANDRFEVGPTAPNIPGMQCQSFMTAGECQLLFNVCDPVICPASRCNLGGKWPVADVIQTGVIGSIALCFPNWMLFDHGDVAIPVCLSGIKAGIDSYLSILKGHRDCLQNNLDTGQMRGICDEYSSFYTCKLFWDQIAPLAKTLIPKLLDIAYNGGLAHKGGGEYSNAAAAWQNTENSIKYFTQTYGANSFKNFQVSSIEEIGATVCKARLSGAGPTSFSSLTQPESPPQVYATFSSEVFTDATVPPTSTYKVYYHIFAGNSSGVYYSVYLKNPSSLQYTSVPATVTVDTGYIAQGQYKDNTKTFTAPQGYKNLCVMTNGQEECGFQDVSTSFLVNVVEDSYTQSQAQQQGITTEDECIGGTPGVSGLLTTINPQAAAQQAATPAIYDRGLVRICATDNPGKGADLTRYQQVGTCGTTNLKCWLDKTSVKNALSDSNVAGLTLSNLTNFASLIGSGSSMSAGDSVAALDYLSGQLSSLTAAKNDISLTPDNSVQVSSTATAASNLLAQINTLRDSNKLILNTHKARLNLIEANFYNKYANAYIKDFLTALPPTTTATPALTVGATYKYANGNIVIDSFDQATGDFTWHYADNSGRGNNNIANDFAKTLIQNGIVQTTNTISAPSATGFSLSGSSIFYNGQDTGLYMQAVQTGNLIYYINIQGSTSPIGSISSDGSIAISPTITQEQILNNIPLQTIQTISTYTFNKNTMQFIAPAAAVSASTTGGTPAATEAMYCINPSTGNMELSTDNGNTWQYTSETRVSLMGGGFTETVSNGITYYCMSNSKICPPTTGCPSITAGTTTTTTQTVYTAQISPNGQYYINKNNDMLKDNKGNVIFGDSVTGLNTALQQAKGQTDSDGIIIPNISVATDLTVTVTKISASTGTSTGGTGTPAASSTAPAAQPVTTPTQTPAQISPIFQVEDGTVERNVYYRYNNLWEYALLPYLHTSVSNNDFSTIIEQTCSGVVSCRVAVTNLDNSLIGKNFEEGLSFIILAVLKNDFGGWFASASLVSDGASMDNNGIFTVTQQGLNKMYLRFDTDNPASARQWQWTYDKQSWSNVKDTSLTADQIANNANVAIINALNGKNQMQGGVVIFEMANNYHPS